MRYCFFFQHVQLVYPFVKRYVMMQDLCFEVFFFFKHVQLVYPFIKCYVMMRDLWFFSTRPACLPLYQALFVMMQDLCFMLVGCWGFFPTVQLVYPFIKRYVMMRDLCFEVLLFFSTRPTCLPLCQALCDDARLMF